MSSPLQSLRRLRAHVGLRLYRWRHNPMRTMVLARSGDGGFGCFGAKDNSVYFARHYLGIDSADALRLRRRWNPCGKTADARRLVRELGLVVFSEGSAPAALLPDLLAFDTYADLEIALPPTAEEFLRSLPETTRSDVRRVRAKGFRSEISRDPAWVGEFLGRHHLPAIRSRHGDDGFLAPREEMVGSLTHGSAEWVRILDGNRCVGAMLCAPGNGVYNFYRLGWLDGDPASLRAGVVSALYWFSIRRALELGLRRIELGGVMADLDNGLFRYKSKWGGRLAPASRRLRRVRLLLDPVHPHARRFIQTHALLARDPAGGLIVLSGRVPSEVQTFPAQAPLLSAWFRLRDAADPAPDPAKAALPAGLRPWFDALALCAV